MKEKIISAIEFTLDQFPWAAELMKKEPNWPDLIPLIAKEKIKLRTLFEMQENLDYEIRSVLRVFSNNVSTLYEKLNEYYDKLEEFENFEYWK